MHKRVAVGLPIVLLLLAGLRLHLVAQGPPATLDLDRPLDVLAVKEQVRTLSARLESIRDRAAGFRAEGETLKAQVSEEAGQLKALADRLDQFSADAQRRIELLKTGEQARQLEALDGVEKLGDEGRFLLAAAAGRSDHQAVRRQALRQVLALGRAGYPCLALAGERLPAEEVQYLAEQLLAGDQKHPHLLAALYRKLDDAQRLRVVQAGLGDDDALAILASTLKAEGSDAEHLVRRQADLPRTQAQLLLFAAASKGSPELKIAALKQAVSLRQQGLVVAAAAFPSREAAVRAEVVRTAKAIGGEGGTFLVNLALVAEDEELARVAAEAAK